jgi:hypothetical protein
MNNRLSVCTQRPAYVDDLSSGVTNDNSDYR